MRAGHTGWKAEGTGKVTEHGGGCWLARAQGGFRKVSGWVLVWGCWRGWDSGERQGAGQWDPQGAGEAGGVPEAPCRAAHLESGTAHTR